MEKELYSKIIYFENYSNKTDFEYEVEKEYKRIRQEYSDCIITKEFYKGNNILIRACKVEKIQYKEKEEEREYIRERADEFHRGSNERERIR